MRFIHHSFAALIAVVIASGGWANAPVEVNTANLAQLEALSGIGTDLAARIVHERQRGPFADWTDLRTRLKGIGPKVAARLSDEGLQVGGQPYRR